MGLKPNKRPPARLMYRRAGDLFASKKMVCALCRKIRRGGELRKAHCFGNVQVDTQNVDGLFAKNTKQFSLCVVLHNLLKFLLAEAGSGCPGPMQG